MKTTDFLFNMFLLFVYSILAVLYTKSGLPVVLITLIIMIIIHIAYIIKRTNR